MYLKRGISIIFLALFLILFIIINVSAATNVSSCGTLSTSNEGYLLNQSLNTTGTCITINASNVTFDGGGYNIDGDETGADHGINASGKLNITIKNVNITDFSVGIKFTKINDSFIENISATSVGNDGVYIQDSLNVTILKSTFIANDDGIEYLGGRNINISENTFRNHGHDSVWMSADSNDSYLYNNTVHGDLYGFEFDNGYNVNVLNNSFHDVQVNPITFPSGIYDSIVRGNYINGSLDVGISVNDATNLTIENNIIEKSYSGISQPDGRLTIIKNNIFRNMSLNTFSMTVFLSNSSVINNTFINVISALDVTGSNISITNNTIINATRDGLESCGSLHNSTISNLIILNTTDDGDGLGTVCIQGSGNSISDIYIGSTGGLVIRSSDNVFNNITSASAVVDLTVLQGLRNVSVINSVFGNYSFQGNGSNLTFKNTFYGQISFLKEINGSGTNLSRDIVIGNNSVFVNSSSASTGLNKSANITLYGLSTSFTNPEIKRDGNSCGSLCYNFTSLNAGNVIFNVSYWTNYSIGEVSSGGSGDDGGSSGGGSAILGFWLVTYADDTQDLNNITLIQRALGYRERSRLKINAQQHYVGVVNLTATNVTVNISSNPIQHTFFPGEQKKFDIDEDGFYDLDIYLLSISNNKSSFIFTYPNEEVENLPLPEPEETSEELPEESVTETTIETDKFSFKIYLALILLIILLIIIVFVYLLRHKLRGRKNTKRG